MTGNSTRKLWVPNLEDVLPENDEEAAAVFSKKIFKVWSPRYLLCLAPGDAIISPQELDRDFCSYIASASGLGPAAKWLITLSGITKPYSIVESILADQAAVRRLAAMAKEGSWQLEPYIESPRIVRLARDTAIPTNKTRPELIWTGIISDLNEKSVFKKLASSLGVRTVPGYTVDSMPALEKAIKVMAQKHPRLMLRKVQYAGGYGNYNGTEAELLEKILTWYKGGRIMVEPFLDIVSVAGSLAYVGESACEFIGVDKQTFSDHKWNGFDYPYPPGRASDRVAELTMKIAEAVRAGGARGFINLDWAFERRGPDVPIALECNFRNNGFGYVVEFASNYFGRNWRGMKIAYRESFQTGAQGTGELLSRLAGIRANGAPLLIDRPGLQEGIVVMGPPVKGSFSVGLFYRDQKDLDGALKTLEGGI